MDDMISVTEMRLCSRRRWLWTRRYEQSATSNTIHATLLDPRHVYYPLEFILYPCQSTFKICPSNNDKSILPANHIAGLAKLNVKGK